MFSELTKKITGVDASRVASEEIRSKLVMKSFEASSKISDRYVICSECPSLKEEFKVFGVTVKDQTPVCGECGCNLWLKIPLSIEKCPLSCW